MNVSGTTSSSLAQTASSKVCTICPSTNSPKSPPLPPLGQFEYFLAKKYSNCPSGGKGGDLGEFVEGQMVQTFEDAVWASELEVVPETFIKTQFGFHVLWVHSITHPD